MSEPIHNYHGYLLANPIRLVRELHRLADEQEPTGADRQVLVAAADQIITTVNAQWDRPAFHVFSDKKKKATLGDLTALHERIRDEMAQLRREMLREALR